MAIRDSVLPAPQRTRRHYARPLPAGRVITQSFRIWFRYFLPITLATAVLSGVVLVVDLLAIAQLRDHPAPADAWADAPESLPSNLSSATVAFLLQGALTYVVLQHLRGRSPAGFRALGSGLRRTVRALPTALVAAVAIGGLTFAANWIGPLASIPAIILACGWYVVVPVAATESTGLSGAFGRSWSLTRGNKWRLFLVQLVFGLIGFGLAILVMLDLFGRDAPTFADLQRTIVLIHVGMLPMTALMAVSAPVAYYLLRTEREGIDVEDIASVFD